jgi:ornithine cyclodeaminase/alanine dehydrogenase-like protein (mu-crystallin family)
LPYVDAGTLRSLLSWDDAIAAIALALDQGAALDGAARTAAPVRQGQLLMMPAENQDAVGFKLVSIAPGNPGIGRPRIQAVYILLDGETLSPVMLLDGTALTTLRTPAVSALAVRQLARPDATRLVIFGSGPQAEAHVEALAAVRPVSQVAIVSRNAASATSVVERLRGNGFDARNGTIDALDDAQLVVCATSARDPLFDGARLPEQVCVVAVGSHQPDARELDEIVFARAARVVVEDRTTALREAGDIIQAMLAGALTPESLIELADLPALSPEPGLTVFKSVGMAWQDLAVAQAAFSRY